MTSATADKGGKPTPTFVSACLTTLKWAGKRTKACFHVTEQQEGRNKHGVAVWMNKVTRPRPKKFHSMPEEVLRIYPEQWVGMPLRPLLRIFRRKLRVIGISILNMKNCCKHLAIMGLLKISGF